jgi:hypothetical protein
MRKYTISFLIWIIILVFTKTTHQTIIVAACAIIHILCLIGCELKELTETHKTNKEQLLRTLQSIGLDLVHSINELKK